ncbi:MAG: hypothetical protein EZS28_014252 [Streblomastix strix]|uniref:Uncharacterized protein n=1 Tax=Streblomastix strix TaxID=222440 RepID=A0A5J4W5K9_9EUKA|nr:MAG: hypothetical protein EZS28_014252 [Streblomastix strix]
MLFTDGPKAKKGRRFTRKIFRILNLSKGAIDMILYGQRYNTQLRHYYAMEKLKKWTQINQHITFDLLLIKPHIIISEVLAQFTSVNTSASSALQFLNGLSSILSFTFDIDIWNNCMLQFTRKAISANMIVKPKYEDTQNVGILYDYRGGIGSNRNLTNIELQTKLTSLLMTIYLLRPAEIEGISLRQSLICQNTDKLDLQLQPKQDLDSIPINYPKPKIKICILEQLSSFGYQELTTDMVNRSEIINMEYNDGMKSSYYQPKEAKSNFDQRNFQM